MIRIGLFTLDSVASNRSVRRFIERHADEIALVGLSNRGISHPVSQLWSDVRQRGAVYLLYMLCNFALPRWLTIGRRRSSLGGLCRELGIPAHPVADINSESTFALMRDRRVDLIVTCYFDQILGAAAIRFARYGTVNIHTSLLPDNRGPMPVLYGRLSEPPKVGVTLHRMDCSIDTGDILAQKVCVPRAGDSVLRSMTDLHVHGVDLLSGILPDLAAGRIFGRKQAGGTYEGLPDRKTFAALRRRGVSLVDLKDLKTAFQTPIEI